MPRRAHGRPRHAQRRVGGVRPAPRCAAARVARPDALRAARQLPEEAKEFVRGFIKSQRVWIKTMERMGVAA